MRPFIHTIALVLLGALVAPVPVSASVEDPPPPHSGPLLYAPANSQLGGLDYNLFANLLLPDGNDLQMPAAPTQLDSWTGIPAKFSPDGATIATVKSGAYCSTQLCDPNAAAVIELVHAGQQWPVYVGGLPEEPVDLSWSPDGTAVAALVPVDDNGFSYRIMRIAVDTGAVTAVLSSTTDFRIEATGISWGPNDLIAFIGSRETDFESHDIYTIPVAGGAPSRYHGEFPADDESEPNDVICSGTLAAEYHQPAWAPDGQSIVARFVLNDNRTNCDNTPQCDSRDQLVQVTPSTTTPRVLMDLPLGPGYGGSCSEPYVTFDDYVPEPVWNIDGTQVLFGYDDTFSNWPGAGVATRILDVDTLATTTVVSLREKLTGGDDVERGYASHYKDWQPCPTGVCVRWAEPGCTITGTPGRDRLVGTGGDDVICGLGKEDVLLGGGGNDVLFGGPGQDDLAGGDGDDMLYGGPDDDALRGDAGTDVLDGQQHKDLVTYFTATGGATIDLAARTGTAPGHDDDTLVSIEGAFGTKHSDQINGDAGSNHLFGGPGNDTVSGLGGTDILRGTGGNDTVLGGAGGDLLFGDGGKDVLNGGATRDACYGGGGGLTAVSCEVGHDHPDAGRQIFRRTGEVAAAPSFRAGGATYWYIGDGDYLFVYGRQATQTIGSWTGTSSWEGLVCRVIRKTPAGSACRASAALQAVNKWQMQWFLWNAKNNSGCAVGIFDYGRHGVNQFQKRWKTRPASYYDYKVAIPWVTPGRVSRIKTSDSREVGGKYVNVSC